MVDLKAIKLLIPRFQKPGKVEEWLKSYPNIRVISRDGADVCFCGGQFPSWSIEISDRFPSAEKSVRRAVEEYMLSCSLPACPGCFTKSGKCRPFMIPGTFGRKGYCCEKRSEGYTVNDIALLLHSSVTTINRYLSMPEDKIRKERKTPVSAASGADPEKTGENR